MCGHLDGSGVGGVGDMTNRNLHVCVVAVIHMVVVVVDGDVGVMAMPVVTHADSTCSSGRSSMSHLSKAGVEGEQIQKLEQRQDDDKRFHNFLHSRVIPKQHS